MDAQTRKREADKITVAGMIVNVALCVLKFIAGVLGASAAMVADAAHSLSDLLTDLVLMLGTHFGSKPPDDDHPYGHARFETFATLIIALVLLGAAVGIFAGGAVQVYKVFKGATLARPGMVALIMAMVSIVSKEALFHATEKVGRKIKSTAVISNAWHHRSDALSSVAALAGIAGAMFLGEKWRVLDPVVAMLVSLFIVWVAVKILLLACDELMDKAVPPEEIEEIKNIVLSVEGVINPHSIRTRRVSWRTAVDLHINIDKNTSFIDVHIKMSRIEKRLKKRFGRDTIISIHPEPI